MLSKIMPKPIEYDKPLTETTINKDMRGILKKIEAYEFLSHSESVPGSSGSRSGIKTRFLIVNSQLEESLEFPGFIGAELVEHIIQYTDKITTTTTYFNPKGRENDRSYRRGKQETERTCSLIPASKELPSYIFRETSQGSL
jgi:hypothetical protein